MEPTASQQQQRAREKKERRAENLAAQEGPGFDETTQGDPDLPADVAEWLSSSDSEFDYDLLTPESFAMFIGPRRQGKTWAMHSLCYYRMRDLWPQVRVMTNTMYSHEWPQVHPEFISEWDADLLASFVDFQKRRVDWAHRVLLEKGLITPFSSENARRSLLNTMHGIIFEDCAAEMELRNDPSLRGLAMQGRHYDCGVFLSTQHVNAIPPSIRNNTDFAFLFPFKNLTSRETIVENYLGQINKNEARALLASFYGTASEDHHPALVVHLTTGHADRLAGLYRFEAKDWPATFYMGAGAGGLRAADQDSSSSSDESHLPDADDDAGIARKRAHRRERLMRRRHD